MQNLLFLKMLLMKNENIIKNDIKLKFDYFFINKIITLKINAYKLHIFFKTTYKL